MSARHLHHQSVARKYPHPADPKDFFPVKLRGGVLSDDSCWDELDSEYEDPFSSQVFNFFDDTE